MRKSIFFSLLCLIAIVAVACGGGNNATGNGTGGGDAASCGGGNGGGGDDYWDRYVSTFKEGRTWTYKMTGDMYQKNEVIKVTEEEAIVKSTTLDKDKKPMDMVPPTETPYKLKQETPADGGDATAKAPEWKEDKVTVEAGEFEVISTDGKTWMMKKHPMIIVKSEAMELVEFKE